MMMENLPARQYHRIDDEARDHTVYVLVQTNRNLFAKSGRGSREYYTGVTTDLMKRLKQHNDGSTRTTRGNQWAVHSALFGFTQAEAFAVERYLKCGDSRRKRATFADYALRGIRDHDAAKHYIRMLREGRVRLS